MGLFPFYKWGKVSIRKFLAKQTWNLLKVMHNEQGNYDLSPNLHSSDAEVLSCHSTLPSGLFWEVFFFFFFGGGLISEPIKVITQNWPRQGSVIQKWPL